MRFRKFSFTFFAVILLGACSPQGTYYERSPDDIRDALSVATLPYHIFGSRVQGSKVSQPDEGTVITSVMGQDGIKLIDIVTKIAPDGTGSRVTVEVRPPDGENAARAAEALRSNGGAEMMAQVANEHVAAVIEGRPFNMMFGAGPGAQAIIAANPDFKANNDAMNAAAARDSAQMYSDDAPSDQMAEDGESDWAE